MNRSLAIIPAALLLLIPAALATRGEQPPAQQPPAQKPVAEEAPVFEHQVELAYTVNNLGYNDTCG